MLSITQWNKGDLYVIENSCQHPKYSNILLNLLWLFFEERLLIVGPKSYQKYRVNFKMKKKIGLNDIWSNVNLLNNKKQSNDEDCRIDSKMKTGPILIGKMMIWLTTFKSWIRFWYVSFCWMLSFWTLWHPIGPDTFRANFFCSSNLVNSDWMKLLLDFGHSAI